MERVAPWVGPLPLLGVVTLALLAPAGMVSARMAPAPGTPVVVVAAPWGSAARVTAEAAGLLVAPGRVRAVGLAYSPEPGFAASLRRAGALMVLDGALSEAFCGSDERPT